MPSQNMIMLQTVANGLSELTKEVVFVGAAVAEFYSDDPAASDIRPTQDVDCVMEISSRIEHNKLEVKLRSKKFLNDTSPGAMTYVKVMISKISSTCLRTVHQ